ncbi:unnamed protein product, partial [Didymodactylos carnosus]
MVWRHLARYLANNEQLVNKLAESYPIRRAAQLTAYFYHSGRAKYIERKGEFQRAGGVRYIQRQGKQDINDMKLVMKDFTQVLFRPWIDLYKDISVQNLKIMFNDSEIQDKIDSTNNCLTLSIRLIRSFEYRNVRHIAIRNLNEQIRGSELKNIILKSLPSQTIPLPFKTFEFDTLKIEHYPHQAKTNDVVIRREDDEQFLIADDKTLRDYKI